MRRNADDLYACWDQNGYTWPDPLNVPIVAAAAHIPFVSEIIRRGRGGKSMHTAAASGWSKLGYAMVPSHHRVMADFMGFEASGAEIPIYGECHG